MPSVKRSSGQVLRPKMLPIFEQLCRCSVGVNSPTGVGTGIVLRLNPMVVLTARHVIADADQIAIQPLALDWPRAKVRVTRQECPAELVVESKMRDVAVLICREELSLVEPAVISPHYQPHVADPLYRLGRDLMPLGAGYLIKAGLDHYNKRRLVVSMVTDCGASGGPLASRSGIIVGMVLESEDDEELPQAAFGLHIRLALEVAESDRSVARLLRNHLLIE